MKYNWNIIGHRKQLEQLEQEIEMSNISHAYLFSGPKNTGKFRIARTFATILECPNDFCGTCEDCHLIQKNTHPDVVLMPDIMKLNKKTNKKTNIISIDEIRELIRKTSLTAQSKHRIIILENIERMPIEAQNSFLKTLEEPIGKTIFLLTTTQINKVLPTIQSRVRQYSFPNISDDILKKYLEENYNSNPNIEEIVNISQGRPGLAINLAKNIEVLIEQRNIYNQIENYLSKNNLSQKIGFVEKLCEDDDLLNLFFDAFYRYLRKLIFDYMENVDNPIKNRFNLEEITNLFESLEKTRYLIQRNVNKKLALENFFLMTEK